MAGFKLAKIYDNVDEVEATISTLDVAVGDCLTLAEGSTTYGAASATTEHWERKIIATDTAVSGTDTLVNGHTVDGQQLYEVESANNSDATDNGDRMLLTDANTVNNTGTDNTSEEACVIQVDVVGAAADKRILVRFLDPSGVNPDAA